MISFAQEEDTLAFASAVLNVRFDPLQSTWIAKKDSLNTPEAVVVYTRFSPYNCEMSIATNNRKRWASKEFLRVCYAYPFEQLALRRVTAVIEEDNHASLSLCKKLGYTYEGRLRHWFGEKDGIVMRILKEECKWL